MSDGGTEDVTFVPTDEDGEYDGSSDPYWFYGATSGAFELSLENYTEYGGPTAVGTYTLTADDTGYDTCGLCIIITRGAETYMPLASSAVSFTTLGTAAGQHFAGAFPNVVEFREVTIDEDDFTTVDVANGRRLRVQPWSWDFTLPAGVVKKHVVRKTK